MLAREAASRVDYQAAWGAIESFVETQRHLLMASDAWLGNAVPEEDARYHPLGLPHGGMPPDAVAKLGLTEAEHHRYAVRDLAVLEAAASTG